MTTLDFSYQRELQIQFLSDKKLPQETNLEKNIFEEMKKCLECELNQLENENDQQQRDYGYKKFDEYYSIFEKNLLISSSIETKMEANVRNKEIQEFEDALDNLIQNLDQNVDQISEKVWNEIKGYFDTFVVSIIQTTDLDGNLI